MDAGTPPARATYCGFALEATTVLVADFLAAFAGFLDLVAIEGSVAGMRCGVKRNQRIAPHFMRGT